MDFFGRQVAIRRLSRRLAILFVLAVLIVAVAVNAVVLMLISLVEPGANGATGLDAAWLRQNSHLVFWTTLVVFGVIAIASLYKTAMLSQGGSVVALALGGERVSPDTSDPLRRRLLNVVEEMAIASGVAMPQVYVLDHEVGINAFAAGHNPANAAIAVTRGALQRLDRAELQGVVAHEFSHILNGDMRLNIRMMGLLFGLFAIAMIARLVLNHAPRSGGGRKGGGAVALILAGAFAVMVLGYVGLFLGRLIQAALSRSRESLADASAVQFTRDPAGLRGALVKIGAAATGSRLMDTDAEEVAHMLFAPGVSRLFATHPPLVDRIRELDPSFEAREFETARALMIAEEVAPTAPVAASSGKEALGQLLARTIAITPAAVVELVGNPGTSHVRAAEALRVLLPETVQNATRSPRQAVALLLAFALEHQPDVRVRQLDEIGRRLGLQAAAAVERWIPEVEQLDAHQRLPAFLRLFPALHQFSRAERLKLSHCLGALLREEQRQSLHGFALAMLAQMQLQDELEPATAPGRLTLDVVHPELQILFSVLAAHGNAETQSARQAFETGMHSLSPRVRPPYLPLAQWAGPLESALRRLDGLQPPAKELLVEALVKTVSHDLRMTVAEAELLRTVCAVIHCPLPPFMVPEPGING